MSWAECTSGPFGIQQSLHARHHGPRFEVHGSRKGYHHGRICDTNNSCCVYKAHQVHKSSISLQVYEPMCLRWAGPYVRPVAIRYHDCEQISLGTNRILESPTPRLKSLQWTSNEAHYRKTRCGARLVVSVLQKPQAVLACWDYLSPLNP